MGQKETVDIRYKKYPYLFGWCAWYLIQMAFQLEFIESSSNSSLPQITFSVSVGTSPCSYAREVREGWTMPDVLRRPTENPMCPTGMHLRVSSALKNWSRRQRKNLARGKGGRKAAAGPRIRHTDEKRARGCAGSVTSSPPKSLYLPSRLFCFPFIATPRCAVGRCICSSLLTHHSSAPPASTSATKP